MAISLVSQSSTKDPFFFSSSRTILDNITLGGKILIITIGPLGFAVGGWLSFDLAGLNIYFRLIYHMRNSILVLHNTRGILRKSGSDLNM